MIVCVALYFTTGNKNIRVNLSKLYLLKLYFAISWISFIERINVTCRLCLYNYQFKYTRSVLLYQLQIQLTDHLNMKLIQQLFAIHKLRRYILEYHTQLRSWHWHHTDSTSLILMSKIIYNRTFIEKISISCSSGAHLKLPLSVVHGSQSTIWLK